MPPDLPQPARSGPAPSQGRGTIRATAAVLAAAVAAAVIVAAAFVGFRAPDSDGVTLRGFQIRVLSISQAAAEDRMDGALAALQALEKDLDLAARDGRISAPRLRGIETALESVRAEISGQLASRAAAAETAAAEETPLAAGDHAALVQSQPIQPVAGVPVIGQSPAVPEPVPAPGKQKAALPDAAKDAKGQGKGQGRP